MLWSRKAKAEKACDEDEDTKSECRFDAHGGGGFFSRQKIRLKGGRYFGSLDIESFTQIALAESILASFQRHDFAFNGLRHSVRVVRGVQLSNRIVDA